jgi:hypothetical protein
MLETACSLSYDRTTFQQTKGEHGVLPFRWDWLYTDGLFKNCADLSNCGVSRVSAVFTDGFQWIGHGQKSVSPCDPKRENKAVYRTVKDIPTTLHTLWAWNTRMRDFPDMCLDPKAGSVISVVSRLIDQVLLSEMPRAGRDLFL